MPSGLRSHSVAAAVSIVATASPVVAICGTAAAARTAGLAHLRAVQYAAIAADTRPGMAAARSATGAPAHASVFAHPSGSPPPGTTTTAPAAPAPAPVTSTTSAPAPAAPAAPGVPQVINTPQDFALALLNALGDPLTGQNTEAIVSWEQKEGGAWNSPAQYNPLNTTRPMAGSYSINGVGVQAYTSWSEGLAATTQTLDEGMYSGILAALKAGNSAQAVERAVASSVWGTGSFPLIP
jgi:hypothetical protein